MYVIINKTKKTSTVVIGNFPNVEDLLNAGDDIIIYSSYSNTIKVPYSEIENGLTLWYWRGYSFDNVDFKTFSKP